MTKIYPFVLENRPVREEDSSTEKMMRHFSSDPSDSVHQLLIDFTAAKPN